MTSLEGLSSYDFEVLVQDLLGAEWDMRLESFAPGRDQGIDVRHLGSPSDSGQTAVLIQCKHYERSGYSALKRSVKREANKFAPKTARRYVLATTVSMTPQRKRGLLEEVPDLLAVESDIFGREDIEALIRKHPEVERAHFKLWLNSTAVLDLVVHNDILARTEDYIDTLKASAKIFVENESVTKAQEILEAEHVCVIAGPPGVGKTTLADILLMIYVANGYEPYVVSQDIGEADAMYKRGRKQVFIYDDFLGRTTALEKLGKNEDQRLLRFMSRVARASSKRFILTTRQYILEQAKAQYERLDSADLEVVKFVLSVGAYTTQHRGHILYNHLYFSALSNKHLAAFAKSRSYRHLADSQNFNPRIIETAIRVAIQQKIRPRQLGPFLSHSFANPTELWRHVMTNQLSIEQRLVLATLIIEPKPLLLDRLQKLYAYVTLTNPQGFSQPFDNCLKGLEGLTVAISGGKSPHVSFDNPGVEDAVLTHILPQVPVLTLLCQIVDKPEQLVALWNYANETERSGRYRLRAPGSGRLLSPRTPSDASLRPALQRSLDVILGDLLTRVVRLRKESRWNYDGNPDLVLLAAELSPYISTRVDNAAVQDLIKETIRQYAKGRATKVRALRIARRMIDSENFATPILRRDIQAAAIEFLISSPNDSESDFSTMLDFRETVDRGLVKQFDGFADRCPTIEAIVEEIDDYMPMFLSNLESEDDLTAVRGSLEEWEGLLAEYGRDIDFYNPDLWPAIERAEDEGNFEPEYDKEDRVRLVNDQSSLDGLFDSLSDR